MPQHKALSRMRLQPIALALLAGSLPAFAQTAPDSGAGSNASLRAVEVKATADKNALPGAAPGGQAATGARLGILGNTPILDAPVSVNAYTQQLMQDQQARTLADVLQSDPSVRFTTNGGHMLENFRIRGLDVTAMDIAMNGLYGITPTGHIPVEMLERVEVLRGPTALFSGMSPTGGVGGTINLATKRAGATPLTELTASYTGSSYAQLHADVGRRFGPEQRLGLRVNGVYGKGDAGVDDQEKGRKLGALALDWQGDSARVYLDAYSGRETIQNGSPAMFNFVRGVGTLLSPPPGDVNLFRGTRGTYDSNGAMLRAELDFNDQWQGYLAFGGSENDGNGLMFGTRTIVTRADGTANGFIYNVGTKSRRYALDGGVVGNFATGTVRHRVQIAYNLLRYKEGTANVARTGYAQNMYNPVTPVFPSAPTSVPYNVDDKFSSVLLADTLNMLDGRVLLTLGARLQQVDQPLAGYDAQRVSPSVGLVVKPWGEQVSLFANYMEGLTPGETVGVGYDNEGQSFKPMRTQQIEAGVKLQHGGLTHTVSAFQIERPSLIDQNNALVEGGTQRLRGVEWSAFGQILPQLSLLGGVSYLKAEQRDTGLDSFGVPEWSANLGLDWATPLAGLSVGGRVVHTGAQWSDSGNRIQLPSWTRFDVHAKYDTRIANKPVRLNVGIDNVANKRYWAGMFSDGFVMPGAPRTFKMAATVSF